MQESFQRARIETDVQRELLPPASIPFSRLAEKKDPRDETRRTSGPKKVLVIDVGGSNVKILATGEAEPRKFPSGQKLTPHGMVESLQRIARDWDWEAVSLGYPGLVDEKGPVLEPAKLGKGWVGFDFAGALDRPVKIMNDAAMQALGSYEGGRMLFLGLGTGLGSTFISDRVIVPMEIGLLHFREATIEKHVNKEARKKLGDKEWTKAISEVVILLKSAFAVDYVMLGGGNAKKITEIPPGARLGHNDNAFVGGFRLWNQSLPESANLGIPRLKRPSWGAAWRVV